MYSVSDALDLCSFPALLSRYPSLLQWRLNSLPQTSIWPLSLYSLYREHDSLDLLNLLFSGRDSGKGEDVLNSKWNHSFSIESHLHILMGLFDPVFESAFNTNIVKVHHCGLYSLQYQMLLVTCWIGIVLLFNRQVEARASLRLKGCEKILGLCVLLNTEWHYEEKSVV